jgi:hypothetical protein
VTQYNFKRGEEIAESIKESKVIGLLFEHPENCLFYFIIIIFIFFYTLSFYDE